jgi:hypothetical protein
MKNLFVALMLVGLSMPAFADTSGPCQNDAALFCPGQTWSKGLGGCLQKFKSKVSPTCANSLKSVSAKLEDSCGEDISKFCEGIDPGKGRIYACLNANKSELSDSCKTGLTSKKG